MSSCRNAPRGITSCEKTSLRCSSQMLQFRKTNLSIARRDMRARTASCTRFHALPKAFASESSFDAKSYGATRHRVDKAHTTSISIVSIVCVSRSHSNRHTYESMHVYDEQLMCSSRRFGKQSFFAVEIAVMKSPPEKHPPSFSDRTIGNAPYGSDKASFAINLCFSKFSCSTHANTSCFDDRRCRSPSAAAEDAGGVQHRDAAAAAHPPPAAAVSPPTNRSSRPS
eukprot:6212622-Pleurochrysis_carterae.AAC.1